MIVIVFADGNRNLQCWRVYAKLRVYVSAIQKMNTTFRIGGNRMIGSQASLYDGGRVNAVPPYSRAWHSSTC